MEKKLRDFMGELRLLQFRYCGCIVPVSDFLTPRKVIKEAEKRGLIEFIESTSGAVCVQMKGGLINE